jgi:hypothetical protein
MIFWEKVIVHKMYVFIFSVNLSETFLILRRIHWDVVISVCTSSCKVPIILAHVNETWIPLTYFWKNTQIWEGVAWINLTEDGDTRQAVVNTEMNLWFAENVGNCLNDWGTVSFWRKGLHCMLLVRCLVMVEVTEHKYVRSHKLSSQQQCIFRLTESLPWLNYRCSLGMM